MDGQDWSAPSHCRIIYIQYITQSVIRARGVSDIISPCPHLVSTGNLRTSLHFQRITQQGRFKPDPEPDSSAPCPSSSFIFCLILYKCRQRKRRHFRYREHGRCKKSSMKHLFLYNGKVLRGIWLCRVTTTSTPHQHHHMETRKFFSSASDDPSVIAIVRDREQLSLLEESHSLPLFNMCWAKLHKLRPYSPSPHPRRH